MASPTNYITAVSAQELRVGVDLVAKSNVTLGLACAAECQAMYDALRAEYDALGGHDA